MYYAMHNTQFSHAYETKFVGVHMIRIYHNPNPTHCVAYKRQIKFLLINTTSFRFIWFRPTMYTHFHKIGLKVMLCERNQ